MRHSLARLRSVLVELAETDTAAKKEDSRPDKGSSLTISTGAKEDG